MEKDKEFDDFLLKLLHDNGRNDAVKVLGYSEPISYDDDVTEIQVAYEDTNGDERVIILAV